MTKIMEETTTSKNEASTSKPAVPSGKSERLRSVLSALRACSRLSEVHNYAMLAFQMKPEVVLNRAQVSFLFYFLLKWIPFIMNLVTTHYKN